jgi:hypothetical protein
MKKVEQSETFEIPSYEEMIELEDTYGVSVARPESAEPSLIQQLDGMQERIILQKP